MAIEAITKIKGIITRQWRSIAFARTACYQHCHPADQLPRVSLRRVQIGSMSPMEEAASNEFFS
jgi:hypothetical protein